MDKSLYFLPAHLLSVTPAVPAAAMTSANPSPAQP